MEMCCIPARQPAHSAVVDGCGRESLSKFALYMDDCVIIMRRPASVFTIKRPFFGGLISQWNALAGSLILYWYGCAPPSAPTLQEPISSVGEELGLDMLVLGLGLFRVKFLLFVGVVCGVFCFVYSEGTITTSGMMFAGPYRKLSKVMIALNQCTGISIFVDTVGTF